MPLLAADGCIRMGLRASEWITVAYFTYLAGAAAVVPGIGRRQRRLAIGTAIAVVIVVLTVAAFDTSALVWRDWMPLMYILLGYRLPALLVTSTNQELERWLLTLDRRWLGMENGTMISERAPRPVIELLELAYLFCYPMVPIGLACLHVAGLREESDRFWTAVLLAVFGCYGVLPWLPTRPPRAIEGGPTPSSGFVRRINLRVLGVASIQLNTFPSGHVAASLATALAVYARLPSAGLSLGLLALAIALGSVVGRYHYAADALAGVALALLGFVISRSA
jgi:membrane-associated phospholipid phosphatase